MKRIDEDKLEGLFRKMELREPTSDFEGRLMQQINIVSKRRSTQNRVQTIVAIVAGVLAMLGLPIILFLIMGWSPDIDVQPLKDYNIEFSSLNITPSMLSLPCIILFLLIGDLFIRRHIWNKKHKH